MHCPLPRDLIVRIRALVLSLFVALALTGTTGIVAAPAAEAGTSAEARLLQKINDARARHGLPTLREKASLSDYARRHSAKMSRQRALFHPRGLVGQAYWWSVAPFHDVVFGGMLLWYVVHVVRRRGK